MVPKQQPTSLCLSAMENALAIYDDLLNANIPTLPDEVMHDIDAVEWSKSMQLELDAFNELGVCVMVNNDNNTGGTVVV